MKTDKDEEEEEELEEEEESEEEEEDSEEETESSEEDSDDDRSPVERGRERVMVHLVGYCSQWSVARNESWYS